MRWCSEVAVGALILAVAFVASLGQEPSPPAYLGIKGCVCHKLKSYGNQVAHWKEKDPHHKAYESLKSEKSKEVAAKMGVADPLTDKRCVECHATAFGVPEERLGSLKMDDGVTCEGCHGPGEKYCKKPIMVDRQQAVANGLLVLKEADQRTKVCGRCHNDRVPKEFQKKLDFFKDWEPIKHVLPPPDDK